VAEVISDDLTKTYCPLPFKAVFVESMGVSPCCYVVRQPVSINQWSDNPRLKGLQTMLLQGDTPPPCRICMQAEKDYGHSLRMEAMRDYDNKIFTELDIDNIDYRASNICNFKCRSCGPAFSHGINQEVLKNPELKQYYVISNENKTVSIGPENQTWIEDNIQRIRRFMFTGGEPTFIPEVKNMLAKILTTGHTQAQILITSNCSWTDDFWKELTEKCSNLHWTASIDATEDDAGIIRWGSDWQRISANLQWLAENAQSLDINTVISNLNVLRLKPLLSYVRNLQYKSRTPTGKHGDQGCRHQFHVCDGGDHLDATNWPPDMKPMVLNYLRDCLNLDLDQEQQSTIVSLITRIEAKSFNKDQWDQTKHFNTTLDLIRGQDHTQLLEPRYQ